MATTINADDGAVSGSAGLKYSSDSTGVLALQTNGTTAVSVSTAQVVTLTNALPVASGGTGLASATGVLVGAGSSVSAVAAGTNGNLLTSNGTTWTSAAAPSGMVYPGSGIANSTGSAWGTSYSTTGTGTVVALATSPTLTTPTINSAQVATVSGTAPLYFARAWVNFNGTGTVAILASGNVTSITDNGTGEYTVNITTAMPDANYAVGGTAWYAGDNSNPPAVMMLSRRTGSAQTTTTIAVQSWVSGSGAIDCQRVEVFVIR